MSSLGAAVRRSAPERARTAAARGAALIRERIGGAELLTAGIAAALAAIPFVTTGGVDLAANTWTEIVLVLVGSAVVAAAVVMRPRDRAWGSVGLLMFAALAVLTLISITWSVQPSDSWVEADRTLSYLAAFAAAMGLARLAPRRWTSLVTGTAIAATIVCGYALLVKVFPASLDPQEFLGRLRAPFTYWNAVGLMAAIGLPPCTWAGAQTRRGGLLRVASVPATSVLVIALVLCYSRGALLVAVIGMGVWFATVPLRLRGAAVLALGGLWGAIGVVWALATHPITVDHASLSSRVTAGHSFGLLLVLLIALGTASGFALLYGMDRAALAAGVRRRVGTALVAAVACVPLAGMVGLAASSRGFTGEVSHLWHTITNPNSSGVNDNAGRLVQVSNSRARYWRAGIKVGEHSPLGGAGAGGYATAYTRYSADSLVSQHAHSYVIETFADLGVVGLVINLLLLGAWGTAAGRSLGLRRSGGSRRPLLLAPSGAGELEERAGLLTLLAVVVTFGAHSAIDWTWFFPGVAIPALVCAGWLAGRGPAIAAARGAQLTLPPAIGVSAVLSTIALVCAWMIWQPLRSYNADQAAYTQLFAGNIPAATADALRAQARNPVAAEPLWELATIQAAGGSSATAHATLVRAVRLQPSNPGTWLRLGEYDLSFDPPEALPVLQAALYLGPYVPETLSAISQARAVVAPPVAAAPRIAAQPRRHRR